ncbi:MAG TPA: hypothetical protein VL527_15400 [Dongiaceae bacterium]|nr:hypothetical protein [Dongiaceae bacterium]
MPLQVQEPFDERGRSAASQRFDAARRLMETDAFAEAIVLLHQAAVEQPHYKTYELLGVCYCKLKRFSEAIPFLAAAATLNRGVRAPSLLAETWLVLGCYPNAADAANVALARDPKNRLALKVKEQATAALKENSNYLPKTTALPPTRDLQ